MFLIYLKQDDVCLAHKALTKTQDLDIHGWTGGSFSNINKN